MKIFVGNLHTHTSEAMLHDLFLRFGEVVSVTIALDERGKPEYYGYVEMKEDEHGREAIRQLNKINFMNQFLDIREADQE